MKCINCDTTVTLVTSDVDAFVLGIEVGSTCYSCAWARVRSAEELKQAIMKVKVTL